MKKSEIREFFRDMRASVSVVARERPTMLPVVTGAALLESAFPFVNIVFSAWILDRLQAGGTGIVSKLRVEVKKMLYENHSSWVQLSQDEET